MAIHVPRVWEVLGRKDQDQARSDSEWDKTRKQFLSEGRKYAYGSKASKEAWKRRVGKSRTF